MATAVKKRWFKILAPKYFGEKMVGEVPGVEPKALIGKILTVNLFTLTDNMKRQTSEVTIVVDEIQGDEAHTSMLGMRLIPSSIRRMIRKGRTRLDQVVKATTKKDEVVTVKLLLITKKNVTGTIYHALNNAVKYAIMRAVSQSEFSALSEKMVDGELARDLKAKLNKIYPLRSLDVREFKLERNVKAADMRRIKDDTMNLKEEVVVVEEPEPVEEAQA